MQEKRNLKIAIYADFFNEKVYQGLDYIRMFENYGSVHLLTSTNAHDPHFIKDFDMLVLPGGADVDPKRYGEKPDPLCGRVNLQYEHLDLNFLPKWLATGKPIVGICRGMQTLNVAMGGSLYQHIEGHTGGEFRKEDHHLLYTNIKTAAGDYRKYGVNSYHHQNVKRLAEGFEVIGVTPVFAKCESLLPWNRKYMHYGIRWFKEKPKSKTAVQKGDLWFDDGYPSFIEVIQHTTKPYVAFQYHPENTNCPFAHYMIDLTLSRHGI